VSSEHTTYEVRGPLAFLTFNRPEARNAMTWEMYQSLTDACDRVDDAKGIRVLILRGAGGKAFVAGTDIAQFQSFKDREDGVKYEERLDAVLDRLERVTKPTIAQIQGVAAGGGCMIALTCDLRIATPDSTFGVPVARTLGNCLSSASCGRLLALMGPARLKEMIFSARLIGAAEANAAGFVNRLVDPSEIAQVVETMALEIAGHAPLTLFATKEMIRRLVAKQRLAHEEESDLIERCYTSADFREGVTSFLEKRKPRWSGS
jgi:enoyl-CoA hydratase/carnithine racemase